MIIISTIQNDIKNENNTIFKYLFNIKAKATFKRIQSQLDNKIKIVCYLILKI